MMPARRALKGIQYTAPFAVIAYDFVQIRLDVDLLIADRRFLHGTKAVDNTDGIALASILYVTYVAISCLNLRLEAVSRSIGFPCTEGMLGTGDAFAANPAKRAIQLEGKVAGAISVVAASVTYKVGDTIVGMRSDTDKAAALNVTLSVTVVGVYVLDLTRVAATLAVTYGIASMVKVMAKRSNVAGAGFFCFADLAKSVLNLVIKAIFGNLGYPFAEDVDDNSYVIAILAVAIGVASMVKFMAKRVLADNDILISADIAESLKQFGGGTGSCKLGFVVGGVGVSDLSLIVALCAVAGRIAIVVEYVAE
jgi:hypothetical protein